MARWLWLLRLLAALLALYALAGFLLVPRLARQRSSTTCSATLTAGHVGALHFNPFTLRAQSRISL